MYDESLKFVAKTERRSNGATQNRHLFNANIDAAKLCAAAQRQIKRVRQITVLAPVRPRHDKVMKVTRDHPILWETGGKRDSRTGFCVIPASETAGLVPFDQVFQIRPLADRPSGWHGAAVVSRGMHFAVGYSDDTTDMVLVYKVDAMCEHVLESTNEPNRKQAFAALDCSLVGYNMRTWKGLEGEMPRYCQDLASLAFLKMAAPSYAAINLEAFRLKKKSDLRQQVYELPENATVRMTKVEADEFLPELFNSITEFRKELKASGSDMAERPVRLRAEYDVTDDDEIILSIVNMDPVVEPGGVAFAEDGSVVPTEGTKTYQGVCAVFKDIAILKDVGTSLVIRRDSHAELLEYFRCEKPRADRVLYMTCSR